MRLPRTAMSPMMMGYEGHAESLHTEAEENGADAPAEAEGAENQQGLVMGSVDGEKDWDGGGSRWRC